MHISLNYIRWLSYPSLAFFFLCAYVGGRRCCVDGTFYTFSSFFTFLFYCLFFLGQFLRRRKKIWLLWYSFSVDFVILYCFVLFFVCCLFWYIYNYFFNFPPLALAALLSLFFSLFFSFSSSLICFFIPINYCFAAYFVVQHFFLLFIDLVLVKCCSA